MAVIVPVPHAPSQHVGDGLEAAMRMVREATDIIARAFRAEKVEHQERVDQLLRAGADQPRHPNAGAVRGRFAARHRDDFSR